MSSLSQYAVLSFAEVIFGLKNYRFSDDTSSLAQFIKKGQSRSRQNDVRQVCYADTVGRNDFCTIFSLTLPAKQRDESCPNILAMSLVGLSCIEAKGQDIAGL